MGGFLLLLQLLPFRGVAVATRSFAVRDVDRAVVEDEEDDDALPSTVAARTGSPNESAERHFNRAKWRSRSRSREIINDI